MNPKISYNPDNIHVWVNLPDLLKLVDLFIRRGFLKEAATCCQLLDHARKDPDVKDFYDDGNEVLLQLDIDTLHDKMDVCSVAVSPQFYGWLSGLSGKVCILSPSEIALDYQKYLQNILDSYKNNC